MADSTSKAPGEDLDESAKYFDFPKIVKQGSEFKVENLEGYKDVGSGIMYCRDIEVGESEGEGIKERQKVSLHYNYYSQTANLIESKNFEGSLDQLTEKFGPGLKEGLKDMKVHGKRRIIILYLNKDKNVEKGGESSDKPGVSNVEFPGVLDVELLSIRRAWTPFG